MAPMLQDLLKLHSRRALRGLPELSVFLSGLKEYLVSCLLCIDSSR